VSKRDDDSQADMEVGMTTAERRRRRRRGGGLRVPSDNVPRRTTPPVVPPVPEDPSLAMSIAYSFSSEASEPVPRVSVDRDSGAHSQPNFVEPVAPEAMRTVIDPPSSPVESVDFEMKTREMNAVDLQALGLTDPMTTTDPMLHRTLENTLERPFDQRVDTEKPDDVEIEMEAEPPTSIPTVIPFEASSSPVSPMAPPGTKVVRERKERLKTVALSEEDLEEVREAVRAATAPAATPPPASMTPLAPMFGQAAATTPKQQTSQTLPLTALDVEIETPVPPPTPSIVDENTAADEMFAKKPAKPEPMSVPEIDINELERSAEASGEIEVDVAEDEIKSGPHVAASTAAPVEAEAKRNRAPSQPPPLDKEAKAPPPPPKTGDHHPPPTPPPTPPQAHADKSAHAHPPPTPPKAPPTPPPAPAKKEQPAAKPAQARTATSETKPSPRGKPWFVDLFDEDYLRTLPFLTPQATQSEAEFVIDAMGLSPGAQVLDVGCGYGRHAMELAARGYHVVGLDLSTPLLVRGGEEAHRRGLSINFIRGDMRELDFDGQFDAAYCLFSTFGYFDDETNKKTVANIARALKPGGRVLIEILNRDYVIADLPTRVWWEGDGCVVLEEVELNYFSSRIQVNRSVVFDDGRQLEQEISVRAYSLHEVGKLMHAAGFRVLEVSGAYHTKGRFFGNQSRHIIVLAERKDTAPSG
jgi:SAM-dependent methyltransferase